MADAGSERIWVTLPAPTLQSFIGNIALRKQSYYK